VYGHAWGPPFLNLMVSVHISSQSCTKNHGNLNFLAVHRGGWVWFAFVSWFMDTNLGISVLYGHSCLPCQVDTKFLFDTLMFLCYIS
jgi:hypothetical protein